MNNKKIKILVLMVIILSVFIVIFSMNTKDKKNNVKEESTFQEFVVSSIMVYQNYENNSINESDMNRIDLSETIESIVKSFIIKQDLNLDVSNVYKKEGSDIYLLEYIFINENSIENVKIINNYLISELPDIYNVKVTVVDNPNIIKRNIKVNK